MYNNKHVIELSSYEVANLREAILATAGPGPLAALDTGDWLYQILHKLPQVDYHPNQQAKDIQANARKRSQNELTLKRLLDVSLERMPQYVNKKGERVHPEDDGSDWSIDQWFNALVGETGEFAGWKKELDRKNIDEQTFKKEGGKELADILSYLVILANRLGVSLEYETRKKFNEVSDRIGSNIKL